MTKHFTLLSLFIATFFTVFSKDNFEISPIDISSLNNPTARLNVAGFRYDQTDYLVIQPKSNSENYLATNNINVESYLGDGFYLISTKAIATVSSLQKIQTNQLGFLKSEDKIYESLKNTNLQSNPITVLFASSISEETILEVAQTIGFSISKIDNVNHHFTTIVNKSQIEKISKLPFVYFISNYYERKNLLIQESNFLTNVNEVENTSPNGYNLKGEGVSVGIWDEGTVGLHIDLPVASNIIIDKELNYPTAVSHPTFVGGCIAGKGNSFSSIKGLSPKSVLYYYDVLNDIVDEVAQSKTLYNIDINNHSYNFAPTTCLESGLYIPEASDLDKVAYNNPTILPVIAVGNTASNCAASDTFSSVDIGFQGCKNAITVGWLFTDRTIVGNSGRGPTADGRLKPELVSKGFGVFTTGPNDNFGAVYGSSFAAPQIAAIAALIHQKYKQQFGVVPNASLVKSVLFNTAHDLGNIGPDYKFGYGIPNANKSIFSIANNQFFEDNVTANQFKIHTIAVPAGLNKLNVTLCWTDKEGSPIASKTIVNNLDLKIVTPAGDTILPWKLDPSSYKNAAIKGIDNLNTNEQVTIDNPLAGSYKIVVKGTSVPFGPQTYAVTYFNQKKEIELTHPNGGEILDAGTGYAMRWNANGFDSLAKIELSTDNGATWNTLITNYNVQKESYNFTTPLVSSSQCLVKISSGLNEVISKQNFTIGRQANYGTINAIVCDRKATISWATVTGASSYNVYLFLDNDWRLVGQTSGTNFTINNLSNGKKYYYAISVIFNGVESNHSLSKTFITTPTACTTTNDVGVYSMLKQTGGRKFTSTTFAGNERLSFIIKNYGTTTQNSIPVSYSLNGGPVKNMTLTDVITTNDTSIARYTITEDLGAVGNYSIVAWTSLPGDNNSNNDTLRYTIRHLANSRIILPISESFENSNEELTNYTFGINGFDYADYNPEFGGRFRTNEGRAYANSGNRAITLDNFNNSGTAKNNELIFTYNLSSYIDSAVYLDFSFLYRGETDGNDKIFTRGAENRNWIEIYDLFANRADAFGNYKNVKSINLYRKLKIENNQAFSTSTQIRILQSGNRSATSLYTDGGYTFDDFRLYNAGVDVSLFDAQIKKVICNKNFISTPISISGINHSSNVINSLQVTYQINNNTPVTETITNSINPLDTFTYTFLSKFNQTTPGKYNVKVWVSNVGDNYRGNDSIINIPVIVMPTIDSFPYYNDFETNNGNVLTDGVNNSWILGTSTKYNINNAAQDNKAWTTGLNKGYNFNENSYLYLGCLDLTNCTKDPLLSFHFISVMQQESDSAYIEYSSNGTQWNRLGCYNCGLNWYNGYNSKPYWDRIVFPWQTAHINIPLANLADSSNFIFRLHLLSDEYIVSEGLAIDDIHILKEYDDIASTDSTYISQLSTGNGWVKFYRNGKLAAELFDDNKNLGNVTVGFEANTLKHKIFKNKNILPRNWVIKPQNVRLGNFKVRLYLTNTEYTNYVLAEDSINRMGDIGMLRYLGLNTNLDIIDNHVKSFYKYYTPDEIQFYPYNGGYYVEFTTDTLGEFYLVSTKNDADAVQSINISDFSAVPLDNDVYLEWISSQEINSKEFVIQYSFDGQTFIDVDTVPAGVFSNHATNYNFLHLLNSNGGVFYYRIKIVDNTNKFTFTQIDSVYFAPRVGVKENTTQIKAYISTNDIMVEFKNKTQLNSKVNIYNTEGRLIFSKKMIFNNGVNALGIPDFSAWSTGSYFMQIQSESENYYSKLLKL